MDPVTAEEIDRLAKVAFDEALKRMRDSGRLLEVGSGLASIVVMVRGVLEAQAAADVETERRRRRDLVKLLLAVLGPAPHGGEGLRDMAAWGQS